MMTSEALQKAERIVPAFWGMWVRGTLTDTSSPFMITRESIALLWTIFIPAIWCGGLCLEGSDDLPYKTELSYWGWLLLANELKTILRRFSEPWLWVQLEFHVKDYHIGQVIDKEPQQKTRWVVFISKFIHQWTVHNKTCKLIISITAFFPHHHMCFISHPQQPLCMHLAFPYPPIHRHSL
jgi:hypothetical protein